MDFERRHRTVRREQIPPAILFFWYDESRLMVSAVNLGNGTTVNSTQAVILIRAVRERFLCYWIGSHCWFVGFELASCGDKSRRLFLESVSFGCLPRKTSSIQTGNRKKKSVVVVWRIFHKKYGQGIIWNNKSAGGEKLIWNLFLQTSFLSIFGQLSRDIQFKIFYHE